MSSPKFMVFKLRDLKIPLLILLIAVLLFVFLTFRNKSAAQTFAPFESYQDGKYIAGISLSDADMDLIVDVQDNTITSVSLSGLDESSSALYTDLVASLDYVNTYVTSTQSLELPETNYVTATTQMLMDAVKVALSTDENTEISSTYQKIDLTNTDLTNTNALEDDIWVNEFEDDEAALENTESQAAEDILSENAESENFDTAEDSEAVVEEIETSN